MAAVVHVAVHSSQFPENVRRDLVNSLRVRQVNHKFLYDSVRQTQKWLALHAAYAPSRTEADCAATYNRGFEAVASRVRGRRAHLVSLGCGGGQKDARLLKLLQRPDRELFYTPVDASTAMVLVALRAAAAVVPEKNCFPLVCDLASAADLSSVLRRTGDGRNAKVILSCLGMLPNFEPQVILPRLAAWLRRTDHLLLSANLAPGPDYAAGMRCILPLYDNALTRDWLMTFLLDLGLDGGEGKLRFLIEEDPADEGLKRLAAYFRFSRPCQIQLDAEPFRFEAGETIRLFFSYRHTPAVVHRLLKPYGLSVSGQWITSSGEEGVFWVSRRNRSAR